MTDQHREEPALLPGFLPDRRQRELIDTIRDLVRRDGDRWTAHRQLVVTALLANGHHPTMDEVLELVRRHDPHVSSATVYRTLTVLVQIGAVRRIAIDGRPARYEIAIGRRAHHHLVQIDGTGVEEFEDRALDAAITRLLLERGLELAGRGVELFVRRTAG